MATQAPTITVDIAANTVTLSGELSWTNVRDGVFLARNSTDYRIVLPYAGTPFDPAYLPDLPFGPLPPSAGLQANGAILGGTASVVIGDPKETADSDSATGLAFGLVSLPPDQVSNGATGHGLLIQGFTRSFQPGRLDGDQSYEIAIAFDETFETASEVIVGMLVRTPIISPGGIADPFISTDLFGEEIYRGLNSFAGIDVDGAAAPAPTTPPAPESDPLPVFPTPGTIEAELFEGGLLSVAEALAYIASHGDLVAAFGADPLAGLRHFIEHGEGEGRAITFDALAYVASHADLAAAFGADASAGARHFIEHGSSEGRTTTFDPLAYVASHTDLIAAFGLDAAAATQHFIDHGLGEGRPIDFDPGAYLASHDDLIAAFGSDVAAGARHFITNGASEGRDVDFDGLEYIASHPDLILALGPDADAGEMHFIKQGFAEGRARDDFDAASYLGAYPDLVAAFGDDAEAATLHFIQFGFGEGRVDDGF